MRTLKQRDQLVEQWIFLPKRVVADMWPWLPTIRKLGRPDATQYGYVALILAAEKFDEERGVTFKTYAYRVIFNYLIQASDAEQWMVRPPRSKRRNAKQCFLMPSINGVVDDRDENNERDLEEVANILANAVGQLPPAMAAILNMRYYGGQSSSSIASSLGYTRPWVSTVRRRAVDMLRDVLADSLDGQEVLTCLRYDSYH